MFIHAHSHVYNVQTVFSSATIDYLVDYLDRHHYGKMSQTLLVAMAKAIFTLMEHGLPIADILKNLKIGNGIEVVLSEKMDDVTDRLMNDIKSVVGDDQDILITPLMSDFTKEPPKSNEKAQEIQLFQGQLELTHRQMLRYPGCVLPFVTMNPKRDAAGFGAGNDAFSIMKTAIEDMGFVGVKLYPTMGHRLEEIADAGDGRETFFQYVGKKELPITMHTNPEMGPESHKLACQPDRWDRYLRQFPGFRINYAHFGGATCFWAANKRGRKKLHAEWKEQILDMMRNGQYGHRVYADVSFHSDIVSRYSSKRQNYFRKLTAILKDNTTGKGVLFGSDFFLILLAGEETEFIRNYKNGVSSAHLKATTETNPRRFLGFRDGDDAEPLGWNLKNFIEKLQKAKDSNHPDWARGADPAAWLKPYLR